MPTVYSDSYWTGAYTYTRVKVEYSGNSATAILLYSRTNSYSGATTTGWPATFSFGGSSVDMSSRAFYGQQYDSEVCRCSFSISPTSENTYWGSTSGETGLLAFSGSVTIPAQNSRPEGLSATLNSVSTNGAQISVSLSSYGVPSGSNDRYIEAAILAQSSYGAVYRYKQLARANAGVINVDNSSPGGTLVIQPNTRYYYGAYATNTVLNTSVVSGQLVTKALPATVQFVSATLNAAAFSYSVSADGGQNNRFIQYSLDNGSTWKTAVELTGGAAQSGSFVINNLLTGANYTMKTRMWTNAGTTAGEDVTFMTDVAEADNENNFYGSVSDRTRKVDELYGEVNHQARRIIKLYGPTTDIDYPKGTIEQLDTSVVAAFNPSVFRTKLQQQLPAIWNLRAQFDYLRVTGSTVDSARVYVLDVFYKNGNYANMGSGNASWLDTWGITTDTVSTSAPPSLDKIIITPGIATRLVHQGFGHYDYGYGSVVYYTDSSHTALSTVKISSTAELNTLAGTTVSWSASIGGVTIPNSDIKEVILFKKVTSLPEFFLHACSALTNIDISSTQITSTPRSFLTSCSSFNSAFRIPDTVTTIGSSFLENCDAFNQIVTIPSSVTSIDAGFLAGCDAFNQNITLPSNLVSIGRDFVCRANNMTSVVDVGSLPPSIEGNSLYFLSTNSQSASMYTTGVRIAGANRVAWLLAFPDRTSLPYRKLLDAGY